jgi:23S rRNA (guanosine2251-2'-O)-methyltransferase
MREWITGRNPVYEVLHARRRQAFQLKIAQGIQEKGRIQEIKQLCQERKIPVEAVQRARLDSYGEGHQGVALETSGYPYNSLEDILTLANRKKEAAWILILDLIQDPQNLGTLLRTAEIVGVHGVLLPLRQAATVTPAVVHASSGASEHLLIAQENLAQAIAYLKEKDLWIVGLEGAATSLLPNEIRLDGPLALVVGNEGQGMRALVRDSCDFLLRLPMRGQIESLNAAVAGSIALYLAWQARGFSTEENY